MTERMGKTFEKRTTVWSDGRSETVETRFAVRPYSKERSVRRSKVKSKIPEDLQPQFEIVQAAILGRLAVNSGNQTGSYPLDYGELGGDDTSQNALKLLNDRRVSDVAIVKEFMRTSAEPQFRQDESSTRIAMSALRSIRGVNSSS